MTATEKLSEERDSLKNARIGRIFQSAFNLFSKNGMDAIAMTDIAKNAEIGVASLYRYFETKDEIAIRTAIWAWENQKKKILPFLETSDYSEKNGIGKLSDILELFSRLFAESQEFFRFIYFFDSYAVCEEISSERLIPYQNVILSVQKIVMDAIYEGISDGSVRSEFSEKENLLYFSIMHTYFSTAQKLSLSGNLLEMDSTNEGLIQLKELGKILIEGIKTKK